MNSGRGLLLLQSAGLIQLRTRTNISTTLQDVSQNPKHLKISELEAAQLPRSLRDADAAVINTNYALAAKLNPLKEAIFMEGSASPYANVLATVPGKANDPRILHDKSIAESYRSAIHSAKVPGGSAAGVLV